MLSLLYLIICFIFGWTLKLIFQIDAMDLFYKVSGRTNKLPPLWTFDIPFSLIAGTTILTTIHYYITLLISFILPINYNPIIVTSIILIPVLMIFFFLSYYVSIRKRKHTSFSIYFSNHSNFYWKIFWVFLLFGTFLMFYSFFTYQNILRSGYTVFGDFAPHTALINSFSKGHNFPTQYSHFSGDGINYHFMFFYLCAILNSLGLRIDFAMNFPSILGLLSFTTLLGGLGVCLTKRKMVFFIAPFMLFFRSSYAIFSYLNELIMKEGFTVSGLLKDILSTDKFIGNSPRDDWGLWSMNVYANQRHFLWGFSILLIILFLFLPSMDKNFFKKNKKYVNAKDNHDNSNISNIINSINNITNNDDNDQITKNNEGSFSQVHFVFTSRIKMFLTNAKIYFFDFEFWKIMDCRKLIISSVLIVCLPYWHGSMLISILCILFVMAFFARNRLSYVIVAVLAVASSLLQSMLFSAGDKTSASPKILWGFISDDKSLLGVLTYLFMVIGVSLLLIVVLPFLQNRRLNRYYLIATFSPIVFALTISLTPDVTVNHKYIIIGIGLLNIFVADIYCNVWDYVKDSYMKLVPPKTRKDRLEKLIHGNSIINTSLLSGFKFKNGNYKNISINSKSKSTNNPVLLSSNILKFILSSSVAVLLTFSLFATGFVEMIGFYNKNQNTVMIDLNSPITSWIEKNTSPDDVFLTAQYHMNEFFFSGRKTFYGWSYYSWSAGHDTYSREKLVIKMFNGYDGDVKEFVEIAKLNKIRYVIIDDTLRDEKVYNINESFFISNFSAAISFPKIRNTTIYKLY